MGSAFKETTASYFFVREYTSHQLTGLCFQAETHRYPSAYTHCSSISAYVN